MDVSKLVVDRNSEDDFEIAFMQHVQAGVSLIHVRTYEIPRALEALRRIILTEEGSFYYEWDMISGHTHLLADNYADPTVHQTGDKNIDPMAPYNWAWEQFINAYRQAESDTDFRPEGDKYMVVVNPQLHWDNTPRLRQRLVDLATHLQSSDITLVLLAPATAELPEDIADYFCTIDLERPGHSELLEWAQIRIKDLVEDDPRPDAIQIEDDEIKDIAVAGAGMTRFEFETALCRAAISTLDSEDAVCTAQDIITKIRHYKTDVVKRNDLLELMQPETIESVGGMERLKQWVRLRTACYSDEAKEHGIEPPKGIVVVGVPGTGKSLVAKAVASVFGIPLVRLDFSKVFNSLVGSSERRMRMALSMVEAMAPCVCFADEIDKGLGGIGSGGGDAGTSMRVLGTFLTWLQECQAPVFTMVTANNVDGLPPELLRRGRFDAIFSTTLPTAMERQEVLRIHLEKRGHGLEEFTKTEMGEFEQATQGYVPAEIEAAVKDALILSYDQDDDRTLRMEHLITALKSMVPLSKSHGTAIDRMVEWSQNNAIAASFTDEERREAKGTPRKSGTVTSIKSRRTSTRRRTTKPTKPRGDK